MSGAGGQQAELGDVPYLGLPDPSRLFRDRAARLHALAPGHAIGAYLELLGAVCSAQAAMVERGGAHAEAAGAAGERPLPYRSVTGGDLRAVLEALGDRLAHASMPDAAREILAGLPRRGEDALLALARSIGDGDLAPGELASAPFVAAALQVLLVPRAARVAPASVPRGGALCPLCGAAPVAGVVLGDEKLRYLACALCGCQWHLTRVTCAGCGSTGGISYLGLDGAGAGVKAETCESCRGYLKLFYLEERPGADPVADDAATYALDVLVAEQGYCRVGLNPMLLLGAGAEQGGTRAPAS